MFLNVLWVHKRQPSHYREEQGTKVLLQYKGIVRHSIYGCSCIVLLLLLPAVWWCFLRGCYKQADLAVACNALLAPSTLNSSSLLHNVTCLSSHEVMSDARLIFQAYIHFGSFVSLGVMACAGAAATLPFRIVMQHRSIYKLDETTAQLSGSCSTRAWLKPGS